VPLDRLIVSGPNDCYEQSSALTTSTLPTKGHVMAESQSTVEYRDIPGFPGYRVSSDGVVVSAWERRSLGVGNGSVSFIGSDWHSLSPGKTLKGHLVICLWKDKKPKMRQIHRLVLEAFVGVCPPGMECCHFDGNPTNNQLSNLRWDTRSANRSDAIRHGTFPIGQSHPNTYLTDDDVRRLRKKHSAARRGMRKVPNGVAAALAGEFGIPVRRLCQIVSGRTWKHLE
jgi:hypothetical protein